MSMPHELSELIERFDRNREAYLSGQYNETQLRREFLDPLFISLGWDIDNKQGYAEAYKDVIHEDAIKIGGVIKAPDYCFRIGGTKKFFVEAKKPSVKLKDDINPAFQLRRYAWSAKLPLSILTDFEEFAVYDCRIKPVKTDKASTARILYLTYDEYARRWDEISSVFSRDAVLKGSFDKYAGKGKHKKGTAEVDNVFLEEIEIWRDMFARNIALRNPGLTQRELNFAVQRIIDRIIFLRICEDRGIEEYGRLMSLLNGVTVYKRLFHIFRNADERYNSGLFHFEKEKDRHELPDDLTPSLDIDDKLLKDIIRRLYYPESPYEFSVLPADILGQVYEQFLGKVIRLTSGHRAIVEEKPTHYYSTWKLFIVDELNTLNTYHYNRATGLMLGQGCLNKTVIHSSLCEFSHFFRTIADFSYRRYLLKRKYVEGSRHTAADWGEVVSKSNTIAKLLFDKTTYLKWIRYLRTLIDLYETFSGSDEFRLAEETKSFIFRTAVFLGHSTSNDFRGICNDVDGTYKHCEEAAMEDGVMVHAGSLERMFPDKKWDLEQNVRDLLTDELKKFNSILLENERLPIVLCDQLFDELAEKPDGTALAAIRKINKVYGDPLLWRDHEIWSGIGDLSRAVEIHGKEWIGGSSLNGVLSNLLKDETPNYKSLKEMTVIPGITDAHSSAEFLEKLASIETVSQIPVDRRYGRHLLVSHLTRNYACHQKGLDVRSLNECLYKIYFSLISTLFVIYASYRKQ